MSELLTQAELVRYLRLDADERKPADRVRSLIRRQHLPTIRKGRLLLFRRSAVDEWLFSADRTAEST